MYKRMISKLSKLNKNTVLIVVAVIAILVTGVFVSNKPLSSQVISFFKVGGSRDAIAKKSVDYLNSSVLKDGQTAIIKSVSEESGLVKLEIQIGNSNYTSYATKDGKLLFPEAFTMGTAKNSPTASSTPDATAGASITPANVEKVDKTSLEAYVVSRCPFGLQMQRAMAEAVKNSPALADYVKVRYIGSISGNTTIAMHGPEEAAEDRRQICLREEQPVKYWPYVACQMKSKDAADGCLSSVGVNVNKLNSCLSDKVLTYAKVDFDLNAKYDVSGSPTMILNGKEVSETPFGGRSADAIRNLVCSSLTTAPAFCEKKLDTAPAAASFSLTLTTPTGGAIASANTACAPAVQ
ncbi:MAG: hypothetical protein EXS48_00025 [Candidatus Staskawiczbacteria bacterium]|nr:hypothetical protein [Candidatus Staskawiczbacteria bacterium]